MQKNEQDNDVRLAATTALFNALEFAHSNFNNDSERNYLMQASGHLLLENTDIDGAHERHDIAVSLWA